MKSISLEPIVFIARTGPDHEKFGDKFNTVCTLVKIDDETLMIKGLVGEIDTKLFKDLKRIIQNFGFTKLTWERK